MKIKILTVFFLLFMTSQSFSQISVSGTKMKKINMSGVTKEETAPENLDLSIIPNLEIEILTDNESIFKNEFKTDKKFILDGNENISLSIKISNKSKTATAKNVRLIGEVKSTSENNTLVNNNNLIFDKDIKIRDLAPGESITEIVSVTATENLVPSSSKFTFNAVEKTDFGGSSKESLIIPTDYVKLPEINFDYSISKTSSDPSFESDDVDLFILPKEYIELVFEVINVGDGPAKNIEVKYDFDNSLLLGQQKSFNIFEELDYGDGSYKQPVTFVTSNTIADYDFIPITVRGFIDNKLVGEKVIELKVEKEITSTSLITAEEREKDVIEFYMEEGIRNTENVPNTKPRNNRYAIIIGNQEYENGINKVSGAENDARLVELYFSKVLGIDKNKIIKKQNIEYLDFSFLVSDLGNIIDKKYNNTIYFYYSGHGLLHTYYNSSQQRNITETFFVPVDARTRGNNVERSLISQNEIYKSLSSIESVENVFVFVDACFSGDNKDRDGNYMTEADRIDAERGETGRGKLQSSALNFENLHRFSAVSSDPSSEQIAWHYNKYKGHDEFSLENGLFTTFLLTSMLKGEDGFMYADEDKNNELTVNEIDTFIRSQVSKKTNKIQVPTFTGTIDRNTKIIDINE